MLLFKFKNYKKLVSLHLTHFIHNKFQELLTFKLKCKYKQPQSNSSKIPLFIFCEINN